MLQPIRMDARPALVISTYDLPPLSAASKQGAAKQEAAYIHKEILSLGEEDASRRKQLAALDSCSEGSRGQLEQYLR